MATSDLNIKTKVELDTLAIVRPGDTLIVGMKPPVSMEQMIRCRTRLTESLPGVEVLIVEASHLFVYRPDDKAGD